MWWLISLNDLAFIRAVFKNKIVIHENEFMNFQNKAEGVLSRSRPSGGKKPSQYRPQTVLWTELYPGEHIPADRKVSSWNESVSNVLIFLRELWKDLVSPVYSDCTSTVWTLCFKASAGQKMPWSKTIKQQLDQLALVLFIVAMAPHCREWCGDIWIASWGWQAEKTSFLEWLLTFVKLQPCAGD